MTALPCVAFQRMEKFSHPRLSPAAVGVPVFEDQNVGRTAVEQTVEQGELVAVIPPRAPINEHAFLEEHESQPAMRRVNANNGSFVADPRHAAMRVSDLLRRTRRGVSRE